MDRLDNKYYVTWGSSLTASVTPAGDTGKDSDAAVASSSGGSLPPQGKLLGKLDQKDFRQVISKGMKTYGTFSLPVRRQKGEGKEYGGEVCAFVCVLEGIGVGDRCGVVGTVIKSCNK